MSDLAQRSSVLGALIDPGGDDDIALVTPQGALSRAALRARVARRAAGLVRRGLGPGERVLVVFPTGSAFVEACLAVWRVGGVVVPIDGRSPAAQATRIARDCQAAVLLADGASFTRLQVQISEVPSLRFAAVERIRPSSYACQIPVDDWDALGEIEGSPLLPLVVPEPTSLALLAYTSGSTGRPKGVMHSHRGLLASLWFTIDHLRIVPADRVLVAFPLYHLFSLRIALAHLVAGATVIAEPDLFSGLHRAVTTRPNALALVPAACQLFVGKFAPVVRRWASSIRRVSIGSAAISPGLLAQVRELLPGARMHIPYGMTEARIGFLEVDTESNERRLIAHDPELELYVRDATGQDVDDGIGELVLRGAALTLGYWHQRPADHAALARDGLRTRDLVRVSASGETYLVGRLDDVISVGGEKVFPLEVEFALRQHPTVADARVSGVVDPAGVRGEIVQAEVVMTPGNAFDEAALRTHCRTQLEPYKVPSELRAVERIPRNAMGKIVQLPRASP